MTRKSCLFADAFQLAYVSRDIECGVATLSRDFQVTGFRIHDVTVRCAQSPGTCTLRVAVAWRAERQIELIQPVAGSTAIYERFLPAHPAAVAFHHLGIRVTGSLDEWSRARSSWLARGIHIAFEGGLDDSLRFAYLDTAGTLGHYIEYLWLAKPFLSPARP
jgi:hypothetical protein